MIERNYTAYYIENEIFNKEEIRIIIRVPKFKNIFKEYNFNNKMDDSYTINDLYNKRIKPITNNYEVEIIDGFGNNPHPNTKLKHIRSSYINN